VSAAYDSSWWVRVARSFSGVQLDDAERALLPFIGVAEACLLRPRLMHPAVVAQVERLPWRDHPSASADAAFEALVAAVPASAPEGDVPFGLTLSMIDNAQLASSFARRWCNHLGRAHCDETPRSTIAFAVSAYAVAACEGLLYIQCERSAGDVLAWVQAAARHVEDEHAEHRAFDVVVVLRAARLLEPILLRARDPFPR